MGAFLSERTIVRQTRKVSVTILFPHHSILLIVHSCRLLTWRGRGSALFLNTAYLLVRNLSTFSLVDLSLDTLIS